MPAPLRRRLSLEGRADGLALADGQPPSGSPNGLATGSSEDSKQNPIPVLPPPRHIGQMLQQDDYEVVTRIWRDGPTPLLDPVPGMAERPRLRLGLVTRRWALGAAGTTPCFRSSRAWSVAGTSVAQAWPADYHNENTNLWPAVLRHDIRDFFAPLEGPVYKGLPTPGRARM